MHSFPFVDFIPYLSYYKTADNQLGKAVVTGGDFCWVEKKKVSSVLKKVRRRTKETVGRSASYQSLWSLWIKILFEFISKYTISKMWLGTDSMDLTRANHTWPTWLFHVTRWQGLWTRGRHWMSFTLTSASLLTWLSIKWDEIWIW